MQFTHSRKTIIFIAVLLMVFSRVLVGAQSNYDQRSDGSDHTVPSDALIMKAESKNNSAR